MIREANVKLNAEGIRLLELIPQLSSNAKDKKIINLSESWQYWFVVAAVLVFIAAMAYSTNAAGGNGWSGEAKLDEIGSGDSAAAQSDGLNMAQRSRLYNWNKGSSPIDDDSLPAKSADSNSAKDVSVSREQAVSNDILIPPSKVTKSDIILSVDSNAQKYIEGAIHIDYRDFSDDSNHPKSVSELSKILGIAGISRNSSVVIYSDDPYAAAYVYLILDYLGQKHVKLLDGGIDSWVDTGKTTASEPKVKYKKSYVPSPRSDLIASYESLRKKDVQVIDARPSKEYATGSIPGSKNVPYDKILDGGKIKGNAALKGLFSGLSKDKPVIVYTNTGAKASLVWYALELEGFNSRIYAGDSWSANLLRKEGEAERPSPFSSKPAPSGSGGSVSPSEGSGGGKPSCH